MTMAVSIEVSSDERARLEASRSVALRRRALPESVQFRTTGGGTINMFVPTIAESSSSFAGERGTQWPGCAPGWRNARPGANRRSRDVARFPLREPVS
jgi:hypothetical protein